MDAYIINEEVVFDNFFKVVKGTLQHDKFDGSISDAMVRLNFERGDAVACLVYSPSEDSFYFVQQFRYPTYHKTGGWILELPAGMVDGKEGYYDAMERELQEEMGFKVASMQKLYSFYVSPGASSERIHLFFAEVAPHDRISSGGGLASENEDIQVIKMNRQYSYDLLLDGHGVAMDAKTMIALLWTQLVMTNSEYR